MTHDDFVFFFNKKKPGMYHDDFSFDVVCNPDDFTLFYKKRESNEPYLQIQLQTNLEIQKKPKILHLITRGPHIYIYIYIYKSCTSPIC